MAFDVGSGAEIWRAPLETTHRGHDGSDDGSISTPAFGNGRVFTLDPAGRLTAFETTNGKQLWRRDLVADFGAEPPWYGFGTTPLPLGENLVVFAGGTEHDNVVALAQATGEKVWSSQPANDNGFASPVLVTLAGTPQIIGRTNEKIFGLTPDGGTVLWTSAGIGDSLQSVIPLPDDRLLVAAWDESVVLEVGREGEQWSVRELWRKPVFKATYSPAVYHDGHIYGMNRAYLTCLEAATGEEKWRQKVYDASLILVGDYLAILGNRSGNFHLVRATPEGFHESLRTQVFNPGARSMTGPMYVGKGFLLRNGEEMVLLGLGSDGAQASTDGGERSGS